MTSDRQSKTEILPRRSTRPSNTKISKRALTFKLIEKMSISAFMMGLSIVLARFCSFYIPLGGMPSMRVSLGNLPIIITSIVCGPIWGMIVGAGSDLIGATAFPIGAYFFGYTIDAAISGVLPWIVFKLLYGKKKIEFFYSIFLNVVALAVSISYLFTHTTYTNGKSTFKYEFELTDGVRWGLTFGLVALALVSFGIILLISSRVEKEKHLSNELEMFRSLKNGLKIEAPIEEKKDFSLLDNYVIFQTSAMLVTVCLLPYWNYVVMSLPYFYGVFNNLIFLWIEGPVKVIIYWIVFNALKKANLMKVNRFANRSYSNAISE